MWSKKSWTAPEIVRRAAEVLRDEGPRSLWFKILGETVYRRALLMERPLDAPAAEVTPRLPVAMGLLGASDVAEYAAFRPGADPRDVRRRLEAGDACFVARRDGRLVAACWAATRPARIDYLDRAIRLMPDEVYVYEIFTSPALRGNNIAPALELYAARHFRQAGYRRLVEIVVPENEPARRFAGKIGARPIGMMGYVKLGRRRWDFCRVARCAQPPGEPPVAHASPYWDNVVERLDARSHYLDPFLGELKRQAHLALIERWGGIPAGGPVLKTDLFEEALGPDAFLVDMANRGALAVGMDVSALISRHARQRDADRRACYVVADARRLPFADGAFALAVSPSTLDHFADASDLGRSLRELARVLNAQGQLVVTLDNRQNIFDPLLRLAARLGRAPYYIGRSYSARELRAELEAAGLAVLDATAILHNPRLVATAAVAIANRLGWPPLVSLVRRALRAAQRLEGMRWRYRTGSFVAARAARRH